MGFIKQSLSDVKEAEVVPGEREYDLRVVSVTSKKSKAWEEAGNDSDNMIQLVIAIEDPEFPDASPIFENIMLTRPDDGDPKTTTFNKMALLKQRRILECLGVPYEADGWDPDDLIDATGRATVLKVEAEDKNGKKTGEYRNEIRWPRLAREEKEEGRSSGSSNVVATKGRARRRG
ncbi:MAG: hypothetical protein C5B59_17385 [Bacteroidetes bacterium]|nr:MAG: hypothetical protein C5B59_17385 [Bacteroidota bacterium]